MADWEMPACCQQGSWRTLCTLAVLGGIATVPPEGAVPLDCANIADVESNQANATAHDRGLNFVIETSELPISSILVNPTFKEKLLPGML
jgi:hypothetical protein